MNARYRLLHGTSEISSRTFTRFDKFCQRILFENQFVVYIFTRDTLIIDSTWSDEKIPANWLEYSAGFETAITCQEVTSFYFSFDGRELELEVNYWLGGL